MKAIKIRMVQKMMGDLKLIVPDFWIAKYSKNVGLGSIWIGRKKNAYMITHRFCTGCFGSIRALKYVIKIFQKCLHVSKMSNL